MRNVIPTAIVLIAWIPCICAETWRPVSTGDCSSNDVGEPTEGFAPNPARCTERGAERIAVCWDGRTLKNPPESNRAWCTYKKVIASGCVGGQRHGKIFECSAQRPDLGFIGSRVTVASKVVGVSMAREAGRAMFQKMGIPEAILDYSDYLWESGAFLPVGPKDTALIPWNYRNDRRTSEEGTWRVHTTDGSYQFCRAEFKETSASRGAQWWFYVDGDRGVGLQYWVPKPNDIKLGDRTRLKGDVNLVIVRRDVAKEYIEKGLCLNVKTGDSLQRRG